jgi:hypothetical protein
MLCSNLQVRLLVEVGAADPSLMDRWQQTPLQEATRSGAAPLVSYLSGKAPAAGEVIHMRLLTFCCNVGQWVLDSIR